MSPYKQGELDCTCGIYSVINSIKYLNDLNNNEGSVIIDEIIEHYGKRYNKITMEGITYIPTELILRILKRGKKTKKLVADIELLKPNFSLNSAETFDIIRADLKKYKDKMIVFVGIVDYGIGAHWTLINKVDKNFAYFFDSGSMRRRVLKNIILTEKDEHDPTTRITYIKPCEIQYIIKNN